jgi:hypothetical protein
MWRDNAWWLIGTNRANFLIDNVTPLGGCQLATLASDLGELLKMHGAAGLCLELFP